LVVIPNSVAAKAGLASGMRVTSVNDQRWSTAVLRKAVQEAKASGTPIALQVEPEGKIYRLDYRDGERYPHLERDPARPDLLEQIAKPLAGPAAPAARD
jgi:S1-C subfamily serine protease